MRQLQPTRNKKQEIITLTCLISSHRDFGVPSSLKTTGLQGYVCAIMKSTLTWGGNNWIRSQEDRDRDSSEGTEEGREREREGEGI